MGKTSTFIPPENITRKKRGDIIMLSNGYHKVVGPKGATIPWEPKRHPKDKSGISV